MYTPAYPTFLQSGIDGFPLHDWQHNVTSIYDTMQ